LTRAEVVSVGTELLLGQIVDTNASFLCSALADLGIGVYFRSTVGDNTGRVREVFLHALSRADLILSTGGLGPTDDDLTVAAAAGALGLPLERHEEAWAHVQEFFRKRNRPLSSQQEKQAMLPRGARMIPNPRGSARGTEAQVEPLLAGTEAAIRERLGLAVYGTGETTLEEAVAQALIAKRVSVAVAESCTGGLLGQRLTNPPGASAYMDGGVITYSNAAKRRWLGVPEALLEQHGAVSAEVAKAMAEGVRKQAGTDLGIAVTGIAGPTGATVEKPIGLVYIALAHAGGTEVREVRYGTEPGRSGVRYLASQTALDMIRMHLSR